MGLITRLRAWIGERFGWGSTTEEADESATAEEDAEAEPSLDPSLATETRIAASDTAVDSLREMRRAAAREPEEADAEAVEAESEAVEGDVGDGGSEDMKAGGDAEAADADRRG